MTRALLRVLPLILLAVGCGRDGGQAAAAPEPEPYRVPVERYVLRTETLVDAVEATGLLEPDAEILLTAEVGGVVQFVAEPVGRALEAGAPVVTLDPADLELAVQQAAAALTRAEAAYGKAQDDKHTDDNLVTQGLAPERQATAMHWAERMSAAQILEAKAHLEIAQRRLKKADMRSPQAAVLSETYVDAGEWISPGTPVARVVSVDTVKAVVYLSERAVATVTPGMSAMVRVDTYPDEDFQGDVISVSPTASADTRTFATEIAIPNADRRLRAGMAARVRIATRTTQSAVVAPLDAIADVDDAPHVFTFEDSPRGLVVRAVPVRLGVRANRRVVLLDGPTAGTEIAANSVGLLTDGLPVQPITDPAS